MDVEGFLGDVAQGGLMSFPAERTDREVWIDPLHRVVLERAVRLGRDAAERDALGGERLLDPVPFRLRPLASGRRLCPQLTAHLARETRDRTETEEVWRI